MSSSSSRTGLAPDERARAAADARGSVLAEGLDPSGAEPDLAAWVRGEIDGDELVQRGLDAASERHGRPE